MSFSNLQVSLVQLLFSLPKNLITFFFLFSDGGGRVSMMRLTTLLVAALLVATCGNNEARTTEDLNKQKFLWKTVSVSFQGRGAPAMPSAAVGKGVATASCGAPKRTGARFSR
ncbi:hypothetical protein C0J52_10670 [Blattella germanica]|nr:hypothetical protein C0J52_10670 [Blattella germanica]